jgi:large subunit ribosomal protein L10
LVFQGVRMNRQEKTQQVSELSELFDGVQLLILTEYSGLNVANMVDFRSKLRENQGGYRIVKNSLAKLALKDAEGEALSANFTGPVGVAYTREDAAATAKVVTEFAKEHPELEITAGLIAGGTVLDSKGIEALGRLPSKDVLRAKLLGAMSGVSQNFLRVLTAPSRDLVGVLEARRTALADE